MLQNPSVTVCSLLLLVWIMEKHHWTHVLCLIIKDVSKEFQHVSPLTNGSPSKKSDRVIHKFLVWSCQSQTTLSQGRNVVSFNRQSFVNVFTLILESLAHF